MMEEPVVALLARSIGSNVRPNGNEFGSRRRQN